jgi:hypothetical protein
MAGQVTDPLHDHIPVASLDGRPDLMFVSSVGPEEAIGAHDRRQF